MPHLFPCTTSIYRVRQNLLNIVNSIAASLLLFVVAIFGGGFAAAPTFAYAQAAPGMPGTPSAINSPAGGNTSLNWSGYDATGGSFTGVGATWTVPQSTAASSTGAGASLSADAMWVGVGGVTSHDLIQAGTQTVWQNGSPSYEAWYELLPSDSVATPITIHPGDSISVSITETAAGSATSPSQWQVSFDDLTTGQTYSTAVNYQSSLSSADWVQEMPSDQRGFVALDNFGTVAFTNGFAIENGNRVSIAGANTQAMTMINGAGQALATASALGSDGASFTVTRTTIPSGSGVGGFPFGRGGRWSRPGVGIQGYVPRSRSVPTSTTSSGFGSFSFGTGNGQVFVRILRGNFGAAFGRLMHSNWR
jgi:hypothetical protein